MGSVDGFLHSNSFCRSKGEAFRASSTFGNVSLLISLSISAIAPSQDNASVRHRIIDPRLVAPHLPENVPV